MSRVVYRVLPEGSDWTLSRQGAAIDTYLLRSSAVHAARDQARSEWREHRVPVHLIIHRPDGTIETEIAANAA